MPNLTFLFPWILAAGAAAAIPILIHLRMRQKPRLQIFPALRFLQKSLVFNTTRLRIRHWLLLAMRMAMLALLAALIARPVLPAFISASEWSKPAALVVVLDTSASMGYRYQGDDYLGRGKRMAQQVIESLPAGSRVAVIDSDQPPASAPFLGDKTLAAQRVADMRLSVGSRPLAGAINRAMELLKTQDMPRKELLVVTDMTSQAWAENPQTNQAEGVSFVVLDCGGGDQANLALGPVQVSSAYLPLGTQAVIRSDVRSAQLAAEAPVRFEVDSAGVLEQSIGLSKGSAAALAAAYRVMDAGEHTGQIVLSADDALAIDNRRYFSFQAGPPPEALVVRQTGGTAEADVTAEAIAYAIAPSAGALLGQWVQRTDVAIDELTSARLAEAPVVILPDVPALTDARWDQLARYVREGGNLWVVAGPRLSVENYNSAAAQQVIPLVLGTLQDLEAPSSPAPAGLADAMLEPFEDKANPPLSRIRCQRRFGVRVRAVDATAPLVYDNDRTPAIVRRRIGQGEVLFWNLCPDPAFSNLASLPQFVILAQRAVRLLTGRSEQSGQVLVGATVNLRIPRGMPTPVIRLKKPGSQTPQAISGDAASQQVSVVAEAPGHYEVSFTQGERTVRRVFSANLDARESDLSVVSDQQLAAMFPAQQLLLARNVEELAQGRRRVTQPLHLDVPVLLALLVLMLAESLLSNRFYRRSPTEETIVSAGPQRRKALTEPVGTSAP